MKPTLSSMDCVEFYDVLHNTWKRGTVRAWYAECQLYRIFGDDGSDLVCRPEHVRNAQNVSE